MYTLSGLVKDGNAFTSVISRDLIGLAARAEWTRIFGLKGMADSEPNDKRFSIQARFNMSYRLRRISAERVLGF